MIQSKQLRNYLEKTLQVLEKSENEKQGVLLSNDPAHVAALLKKDMPKSGEEFQSILEDFQEEILPHINRNTDPEFGAYITGSGNKVSAIAEFIKGFLNQNGLKWNNSPVSSELEQLIIRWIADFHNIPQFGKGVLTSGGSMSNLLGVHFALAARFPERESKGFYQQKPFVVYCSNQTHSSVDRAMVFLGLGRDYLRKIEVNEQFEIRTDQLEEQIQKDKEAGLTPLMIIGNAGTTNTGSIDDLSALGDIAKEFDLWYHVDGAYGLPAIRIPSLTKQFDGIEKADSIIINPHKWMYVTFEASCVLLKEIPQAINFSPDYLFTMNPGLRWESSEHTIELSKEFRALKIWFTMKYFGADQLTRYVEQDIQHINYLSTLLEQTSNMEVESTHPLSILCFRWSDPDLTEEENETLNVEAIREIETEGKIFITGTRLHGKTYLRVYYGNPERTQEDVKTMFSHIKSTFQRLSE